jgi:hypothetical protein
LCFFFQDLAVINNNTYDLIDELMLTLRWSKVSKLLKRYYILYAFLKHCVGTRGTTIESFSFFALVFFFKKTLFYLFYINYFIYFNVLISKKFKKIKLFYFNIFLDKRRPLLFFQTIS